MNAMGHDIPNVLGVDQSGVEDEIRGSESSSLAAAAVMWSSYPATAPEILDDLVEAQQVFVASLGDCLKVGRVLSKGELNAPCR